MANEYFIPGDGSADLDSPQHFAPGDGYQVGGKVESTLAATIAPITASFTGGIVGSGSLSCTLAPVTASFTGTAVTEGTLSATLAPVIAAFLGAGVPAAGILTVVLAPVTASISGTAENQGILSATLGQIVASIEGTSGQAPVMGPFRYPGVDPDHPDGRRHRRQIAKVVNNLNQGKISSTGKFTLTVNANTTTLVDARLGPWSLIFFDPLTGSAATELYGGTMYVTVTDRLQGQCIITHVNSADAAREFRYFIVG